MLTTTSCELHGNSLLKVVQTGFSIHLNSKSGVNQGTAKAGLIQMVNLVFSRMEKYSEGMFWLADNFVSAVEQDQGGFD